MSPQPPITLSRADAARLGGLIEAAPASARHLLLERLEHELHRAHIVEESSTAGVVTLGSRVEYEHVESGNRREVELVLPEDAQPGTTRLSVLSPLGCSLIGLREGATFTWDDDVHRWRLRVVAVRK
ncbi:MAG: GreA/GreB family elongation factor [Myxococcales bacterium]|nr:GreA/GreB family elongation factor [Myxococcales bacterium]